MLWNIQDLSFPARDQICVPCIRLWILNHWTTREGPAFSFSNSPFFFLSLKWSNTVFFYLWKFRTFPDYYFFNSLINFWLCWVFLLCGFSLGAESGGYSSLPWAGFSLQRLLSLQSRLYGLQQLLHVGSAAPQRVGSSRTWDRGSVFCIGHFLFFVFTTEPPGRPLQIISWSWFLFIFLDSENSLNSPPPPQIFLDRRQNFFRYNLSRLRDLLSSSGVPIARLSVAFSCVFSSPGASSLTFPRGCLLCCWSALPRHSVCFSLLWPPLLLWLSWF